MKRQKTRCLVLGGGGHARMLIESLRLSGLAEPSAVLDADCSLWGQEVLGVPVVGGDDQIPALQARGIRHFVVGVGVSGAKNLRRRLFELARARGLEPISVVHPAAVVSALATVAPGAQILPMAIVNIGAVIGANAIINSAAVVEHDCEVGAHAHVASGAVLAGGVRVGAEAQIGAGAVVKPGVQIGRRAVVGAGAAVVKDVPTGTVVAGVPAKPLVRGESGRCRRSRP